MTDKDELIPGEWYWVCVDGCWFPAMHNPEADGGWTNIRREVEDWQRIPPPEKLGITLWDELDE